MWPENRHWDVVKYCPSVFQSMCLVFTRVKINAERSRIGGGVKEKQAAVSGNTFRMHITVCREIKAATSQDQSVAPVCCFLYSAY